MSGDQSFDEDDEEEEEDMRTAVKRGAPAAAKPSVRVFTNHWVHSVGVACGLMLVLLSTWLFFCIEKDEDGRGGGRR